MSTAFHGDLSRMRRDLRQQNPVRFTCIYTAFTWSESQVWLCQSLNACRAAVYSSTQDCAVVRAFSTSATWKWLAMPSQVMLVWDKTGQNVLTAGAEHFYTIAITTAIR